MAVNQALKAVAVAQSCLEPDGPDGVCALLSARVMIDGQERVVFRGGKRALHKKSWPLYVRIEMKETGGGKVAVITISRELGSEGDKIADLLCQELGYRCVDKAMLTHIAEEAGVDIKAVLAKERSVTRRPRLISDQMTSLYGKDPTAFGKKAAMNDQVYARVVHETMERFAREGEAIIVGRGSQMILRDWPTVLHVHLYAPPEVRVQRLMQRFNISEPEARRRIARSDEQKRQYTRHMHNNANWKDLKHYHLAINTAHISLEVAAQIIILAAKHKENAQ